MRRFTWFNAGKLVTVWAGFSTKWYGKLLGNEAFLDAAWVTVQVAVVSSFIGIGLDRGIFAIIPAHTTFSMCYVFVVVSSRLVSFDQSLEEAALDLGCTLLESFRLVTLSIKIFSAVRLGVSPEFNALSTIMIGIVAVGGITASVVTKRAAVRARRDEQAAAHR